MRICIVGAGNIGLVLAGVMSRNRDVETTILTNRKIDTRSLVLEDAERNDVWPMSGVNVSDNPEESLETADYVLCTYPAFLRSRFVQEWGDCISAKTTLVFVPGYGGAEYMCRDLVSRGVIIAGLQRVPFISRQKDHRIATLLSRKNTVFAAAIPSTETLSVCRDLQQLLGISTVPLMQYLAVTLVPSNPLLHLTGLYNVFNPWTKGDSFERQLMFYEEWTDAASEMLLAYDSELQAICERIPLDLSEVVSLRTYYESATPAQMTKKLKSIESFGVVQVPLITQNGRYYPDFESRMFVEDFPFGIAIIKDFANMANVETPTINKILRFYYDKVGIEYFKADGSHGRDFDETGAPSNFGLDTLEKVVQFYAGIL